MRKYLFMIVLLFLTVTGANAAPYNFNGTWVDVEAWTGTGSNESILVVDWNCLDNPQHLHYGHESYAFGYRWDGDQTEYDMLMAFHNAGILTVSTGYGGDFVLNIVYDDGQEVHQHVEQGSWNLASTSDPDARWGTWGDSEWDFNTAGITQESIADGQYEGINAIMWFGSYPDYGDPDPGLNIPFSPVPIPGALWLLGSGVLGLVGIRRKINL